MVRCVSLITLLLLHSSVTNADSHVGIDGDPVRREMVLVTADPECTSPLSSIELRKLFLGLRTSKNRHVLKALRNSQSSALNDLFIQSVMAMSPRTYERRLIMGTFQKGLPRPAEMDNLHDLRNALQTIPCSATYMWANQARTFPEFHIIQTLWSGFLTD